MVHFAFEARDPASLEKKRIEMLEKSVRVDLFLALKIRSRKAGGGDVGWDGQAGQGVAKKKVTRCYFFSDTIQGDRRNQTDNHCFSDAPRLILLD